jgi:peptidoglycan biosynthesis protein MviN/MurJ (putative lipid II flippase)
MAPLAIGFGVLLTLLGGAFCGGIYASTEKFQVTALIPAFFGLAFIVLGIVARNDKARMHAMHGAAFLGLVGFAMPTYMVIKGLIGGDEYGLAKQEQTAMAVLCLVFVGFCVKSFIDARKARKAKEASAPAR